MSPQVHLSLYKGFLRLSATLTIPDWALGVLPCSKFGMDANTHPDVRLLAVQISKDVIVNAKVKWFCLLRESLEFVSQSPAPLSGLLLPILFGSYNFKLTLKTSVCLRSSTNPWLLLLFPSTITQ